MKPISNSIFPSWLPLYCLLFYLPLFAQSPKYFVQTPIWGNNVSTNGFNISMLTDTSYIISGGTLSIDDLIIRGCYMNVDKHGNIVDFSEYPKPDTSTRIVGMATNINQKKAIICGGILDSANTIFQEHIIS